MKGSRKLFVLIIICSISCCNGTILPCNKSIESKVCFNLTDEYIPTNSPEPLPTIISTTIKVGEIIGVNEEEQTVTLLLKIILEWNDTKLSVVRSKKEENKYILIFSYIPEATTKMLILHTMHNTFKHTLAYTVLKYL